MPNRRQAKNSSSPQSQWAPIEQTQGQPAQATVQANFQAVQYQSPIPPPEVLAGYNAVIPGGAERILAMAERQEAHRQGIEVTYLKGNMRRANWGLAAGFMIAVVALGATVWLGLTGHDATAGVVGGLDLVGLVTAFIYGSTIQRNERKERAEILAGRAPDQHN